MLARWIAGVLRHRLLVAAVWLALLAAGIVGAAGLSGLLTNALGVPGSDSARAQALLAERFDERPDGTFVVVVDVASTSDEAVRERQQARLNHGARAVPGGRAGDLRASGGVLYGEVRTAMPLQEAKRHTEALRAALADPGEPEALVTGQPAIQHDIDPVFTSDLRRGEAIAIPIALVTLLAVLGVSLAALVPLAVAACTVATTLGIVSLVARVVDTGTYVVNLVELIGLGLAIDYAFLVVQRFREELWAPGSVDDAVIRTMATAGRAVVFSALAVGTGLGLLCLVPVPFLRAMGIGGLLVALVSAAAALTLLPVLLGAMGRRGVARLGGRRRQTAAEQGGWARLARAIMRRPLVFLAVGAAVLIAAATPVGWIHVAPGSIADLPGSSEALRGFDRVSRAVGQGVATPTEIVIDTAIPGAARDGAVREAVTRLVEELANDPEVAVIASGRKDPYVDPTGGSTRVSVSARHEYASDETRALVQRVRSELVPAARFPADTEVVVGGAPAQSVDFVSRAYGAFPWLVAGVLLLTGAGLVRAFRSLVLPLKAVALNLVSVAAVYGLLVVVFQWGVGSGLLGLERVDAIEAWVPIVLFATLFGVSMDYEVFLVSRMREGWDAGEGNERAVALGLERTGRVVTAAALVMVAAFSGFVGGRIPGLEQLGVGLVLGVLLDATLVRSVLVPALMAVLGRWNWWLPAGIARLLRVEPSPLRR